MGIWMLIPRLSALGKTYVTVYRCGISTSTKNCSIELHILSYFMLNKDMYQSSCSEDVKYFLRFVSHG